MFNSFFKIRLVFYKFYSPVLNTLVSIVFIFNKLVFNFNNTCYFKLAKFDFAANLDVSRPAANFMSASVA